MDGDGLDLGHQAKQHCLHPDEGEEGGGGAGEGEGEEEAAPVEEQQISGPDLGLYAGEGEERGQ